MINNKSFIYIMSLLYNKLIESIKTAIYESLFDDIDDDIISDDNTTIIDNISNNL